MTEPISGRLILEDGAKFMGVLALAVWSVTTAADIVRSVVAGAGADPAQTRLSEQSNEPRQGRVSLPPTAVHRRKQVEAKSG